MCFCKFVSPWCKPIGLTLRPFGRRYLFLFFFLKVSRAANGQFTNAYRECLRKVRVGLGQLQLYVLFNYRQKKKKIS